MAGRITHHIDVEAYGEITVKLAQGYNEIILDVWDSDHDTRIIFQLDPEESKSLRGALKSVEKQCDD